VPIDNNASERILRGPVVGRKTWYGTHSKDGALAAAVHFSLVQSCRLVGLNPRTYYRHFRCTSTCGGAGRHEAAGCGLAEALRVRTPLAPP
jgi:hypothetical protein